MNKRALDGFWDQFRQKYGVYLRLLDVIPADRYQSQPVPLAARVDPAIALSAE